MKTQKKVDVLYSRECTCRAMAVPAPNKHGTAHYNRGFTLIEVLMVVAIISALALIAIPNYASLKNMANIARCKSEIRTVEKSIIAYNLDNAKFPDGPLDTTVTTTLIDPWGNYYQYYNIQKNGTAGQYVDNLDNPMNDDFDLYSMGINGVSTGVIPHTLADPKCMDDIIRVADGTLVELGSDY